MIKLHWLLKYDLKWYLDRYLKKNKESTEQYKEIIEILKIILGEPKDSAIADSKTALDAGDTEDAPKSVLDRVVTIDPKSIQEAIPKLIQLAGGGNVQSVEATFLLGMIYRFGIGVAKDAKSAVEYFQIAVKSEHAPALNVLGCCHEEGNGVEQNMKAALDFYKLSEQHIWAPAYYSLARLYEVGNGVAKDLHSSAHYYGLAAGQGYAPAEGKLAIYYQNDSGVYSSRYAIQYYRSAALHGCVDSRSVLGNCYLKGGLPKEFVGKDIKEALRNIQLAFVEGHPTAQNSLSECYSHGWGVGIDLKRHVEFSTLSATQGYGAALYSLGISYFLGIGVFQDSWRAVLLLSQARDKIDEKTQSFLDVLSSAIQKKEDFADELDAIMENCSIIDTHIDVDDIDKIDEKYIEFFPYAAFLHQLEGDHKNAEKLYLKAIEYHTTKRKFNAEKGDLQAENSVLQTISRLHWDLYFCYQCQKQNKNQQYVEFEFDAKILTQFYEKIRYSVKEGNYHDLELLAYMNEQRETNLEGNWNAAVNFYHQLLDQLQKETDEVRVTDARTWVGFKKEQSWEEAFRRLKLGDFLRIIDNRNSPQKAGDRWRKIVRAEAQLYKFTPLLKLRGEIEADTGLYPDIAALVISYMGSTDVEKWKALQR